MWLGKMVLITPYFDTELRKPQEVGVGHRTQSVTRVRTKKWLPWLGLRMGQGGQGMTHKGTSRHPDHQLRPLTSCGPGAILRTWFVSVEGNKDKMINNSQLNIR